MRRGEARLSELPKARRGMRLQHSFELGWPDEEESWQRHSRTIIRSVWISGLRSIGSDVGSAQLQHIQRPGFYYYSKHCIREREPWRAGAQQSYHGRSTETILWPSRPCSSWFEYCLLREVPYSDDNTLRCNGHGGTIRNGPRSQNIFFEQRYL